MNKKIFFLLSLNLNAASEFFCSSAKEHRHIFYLFEANVSSNKVVKIFIGIDCHIVWAHQNRYSGKTQCSVLFPSTHRSICWTWRWSLCPICTRFSHQTAFSPHNIVHRLPRRLNLLSMSIAKQEIDVCGLLWWFGGKFHIITFFFLNVKLAKFRKCQCFDVRPFWVHQTVLNFLKK